MKDRSFTLALPFALIALLVILLTGCATRLPARIEVPIPVPCRVEMPARPVWATDSLPATSTMYEDVRAILAERRQMLGYQSQLEAAIAGCQP